MSRIQETFERLKTSGQRALIPYITAGDPDMATTDELLDSLITNGADIIELGVPFSDPMADGPTIQAASQRALKNPFSIAGILQLVENLRRRSNVPVILFGYYNPFYQYGLQRLCREAAQAGVDGFLVVDLPPEEAEELKNLAAPSGLDIIYLLAPTSTEERIRLVCSRASGFVYFVSVTGVTGARNSLDRELSMYVDRIRRFTDMPVGVGFGVSSPEHVRELARYADAIIVGSAIIKVLESVQCKADMMKRVGDFVKTLKEATLL